MAATEQAVRDELLAQQTDIGPSFQAYRQQAAEQGAADELRQRVATRRQSAAAEAAPTAEAGVGIVGRVASDVGRGITETPRAIVKGARDAFASLFDMGDEFAGWLHEKAVESEIPFLSGGIRIDETGVHWMGGKETSETELTRTSSLIPDIDAPKTVTGGMVKGVAQFITGMAGAGRLLKGLGIAPISATGQYAASTAKGALSSFTAFDPHQKRLSDLIEEFPVLSNPVTEYLSSSPEDSAAEGRLKNAVEGIGFGLLTDGFVKGVKLLRQSMLAKAASGSADEATIAALEVPRQLPDDAFATLGSEADTALVRLKPSPATLDDVTGATAGTGPRQVASSAAGRSAQPKEAFINFARINEPDDVKRVMQRLSDIGTEAADSAKAGSRSFRQVELDAAHQDAWQALVSRRPGQPLSDAESVAARQLWASTTDKVAELAELASTNPSEANLFAFRKMLDVHDLVQREVLGARASTARALASWRIPAGGSAERLRNVTAALDAAGGSEVARELAARVSALARSGNVAAMTAVAEKGAYARTRDAVIEAWINGLLSNPATHAANVISNSSVIGLRMAERAVAEQISSALGTQGGVEAGEAAAQWFGMMQGTRDMFRYYSKLATTPLDGIMPTSPVDDLGIPALSKIEHPPSISADALRLSSSGFLGRSADIAGELVRTPGRALGMEDEFFKTLGYRMELNAQALRTATSEVTAGTLQAGDLKRRIAEIIATPPESVRLAAADAALYQTFNNAPGDIAKAIGRLTGKFPALKVIFPFTRTPANILTFTFERTPIAPVMSRFKANIAAGGARRDLALAQMAIGTTAMLTATDLALNGTISGRGPTDKGIKQAMMREGWQPYSMKIGDRWYSYNRLDPVGSLIGMSADVAETLVNAQHEALDDADTEKLAVAAALAFAGNLTNKTYLSGLSGAVEALSNPTMAAESWSQRLAGSLVPAGVAQIERLNDPVVREVYSMMDAIRARTPGLSESLPPRLDLWGQPLKTESGLGTPFDAFSPVYTRESSDNPIDKEILRIGANITAPGKRTAINGVNVDLSQFGTAYSRYVELSGNAMKTDKYGAPITIGGMGARDYLNAIVTNRHPLSIVYNMGSDGPDGDKDVFIRDVINKYRAAARAKLLDEYPALRMYVEGKQEIRRAARFPNIQ